MPSVVRRAFGTPRDLAALIIGGCAGAAWLLVFFPDGAAADDCLQYVKNVKNFVAIPRGLLEDCMRTGSVQAIITATIGTIGGGITAKAISDALKEGAKQAGPGPHVASDDEAARPRVRCPKCGAWIPSGEGACVQCGEVRPPAEPKAGTCPNCGTPFIDWGKAKNCRKCGEDLAIVPRTASEPAAEEPKPAAVERCTQCGSWIPPEEGWCAQCGAAREQPANDPRSGNCPNCGEEYIDWGKAKTCRKCQADLPIAKRTPPEPPPERPTVRCGQCGAWIPSTEAVCLQCGSGRESAKDPRSGECPNCGEPYIDWGKAKACKKCQQELPIVQRNPDDAWKPKPDGEPTPTVPTGDAGGSPSAAMSCPICGVNIPAGAPTCPGCKALVTPPDPAAAAAGSTSTPATGGGPASMPGVADPPFNQQGVVKGDKAARLLEEAGLAKVTRDNSGKVVKVEEAFPGAFTNLGGKTVTLQTSESSGGGTGPDFVEEAKGQITGIGFKPNPDGSIGEPVVVVNHGDSKWREVVPPTPDPFTVAIEAAKQEAAKLAQQAADAAKKVQDSYKDAKAMVDKADTARSLYKAGKIFLSKAEVDQIVQDLAKDMGVDPVKALEILNMDSKTWKGIKAGIELPGTFLGD